MNKEGKKMWQCEREEEEPEEKELEGRVKDMK